MLAMVFRRWHQGVVVLSLGLAIACMGGARVILQHHWVAPNDLAAALGDESTLVRVRGIALRSPEIRHRIGGALARFDYRPPAAYFPMRVVALFSTNGEITPATGEVIVRVDEPLMPFRAGDTIETMGFLMRPAEPRNPGEFNYREYAQSLGQAGFLSVASRELVQVTPAQHTSFGSLFLNWRDQLRRRAGAWLLADLPESSRSERDSLLGSIMLGERDEQIDGVYGPFQRVGLAHVLAISGFHLGVLAGFVLLAARAMGGYRRWHAWIVIVFVLLYLLMVEARMPVLRAGVMTSAAMLGMAFGRRFNVSGLVCGSAVVLLLWNPDQLFNAGFQLTFGVVLGLVHLAPTLRRRMFGRADPEAPTVGAMLLQWLYTAMAASLVAWLIALPIVLYHFGVIAPLAVVLSVVTLPLAAAILALGFVKIALSALLPSAAMILGLPLSLCANILLDIVLMMDGLGWVIHLRNPSTGWTLAAMVCVCWMIIGDARLIRLVPLIHGWISRSIQAGDGEPARAVKLLRARSRAWGAKWILAMALSIIAVWPTSFSAALRIDMLAVGDGSCFVIRSADSTVVFDAGSSTDLNVARRSLIPAMRRLGVRHIDAIVVSHADFDHYSAVVDLVEEFDIKRLIVMPQFLEEARTDRDGSAAYMLEQVARSRVVVDMASAGFIESFGEARWTWLHPDPNRAYRRGNDASMVIRIEYGERRVLLCGDIQREAIEQILADHDGDSLRADVMELPHHGSYIPAAVQFVQSVKPDVVMQSTGWARWQRDRWGDAMTGVHRLVTARDGACWVEIHHNGTLTTGTYLDHPLIPMGHATSNEVVQETFALAEDVALLHQMVYSFSGESWTSATSKGTTSSVRRVIHPTPSQPLRYDYAHDILPFVQHLLNSSTAWFSCVGRLHHCGG